MIVELPPLTKEDLRSALISSSYIGETPVLGYGFFNFVIEEPGDPSRARKYLWTPGVIPSDDEQGEYKLDISSKTPTGTFSRFLYGMPRVDPTFPTQSTEAVAQYIKTEFGEGDDRALAIAVGKEKTGLCQITNELFIRAKVGVTRCVPRIFAVVTKPAYDASGNKIRAQRIVTEIPPDGPSVILHEQLTDMLVATNDQEEMFVSMERLPKSALEETYPIKHIFEQGGMIDMFRALEQHADFIIRLGQEGIMNFDKFFFFPVPNPDGFRLVTFDWGIIHKIPVDDFVVEGGSIRLKKHHYAHIINRYQKQIAVINHGLYEAQKVVQGDRHFDENVSFIQKRLERLREWLVIYQDFTYPVDDMAQLAEERSAAATSLFSPFSASQLYKDDFRDKLTETVVRYQDIPGFPKDLVLAWRESVLNIAKGAAYLPELRKYRATLRRLRAIYVGDVSPEAEIVLVGSGEAPQQSKLQASEPPDEPLQVVSAKGEYQEPKKLQQTGEVTAVPKADEPVVEVAPVEIVTPAGRPIREDKVTITPETVRRLQEEFPRSEYYFVVYDELVRIQEEIRTPSRTSTDIPERERVAALTDLLREKLSEFVERARVEMVSVVDKRDLEDTLEKLTALRGFDLPDEVKLQITIVQNAMSNYFYVKDVTLHPAVKTFNNQIVNLLVDLHERRNQSKQAFLKLEEELQAAYESNRNLLLNDELVEDRLKKDVERYITHAKEQLRESGVFVV